MPTMVKDDLTQIKEVTRQAPRNGQVGKDKGKAKMVASAGVVGVSSSSQKEEGKEQHDLQTLKKTVVPRRQSLLTRNWTATNHASTSNSPFLSSSVSKL